MAQVAGNLQRIRNGKRTYAITPRIPGGSYNHKCYKNLSMWQTHSTQL